jgi:signal peptidase I
MKPQRIWLEWVRPIVLVAAVVFPFRSVIADWNTVPSGSMKPTIVEGDRIFVNKLAYSLRIPFTTTHLARWSQPQAGEIVICYAPDNGVRLVKRVVGAPGDVLEIRAGRLHINGKPLKYVPEVDDVALSGDEDGVPHVLAREQLGAATHHVLWLTTLAHQRWFGPAQVPADHYFVMGDNRDNSRDSRSFGFIPARAIVGRATTVVASFDPERAYLPRADRFLVDLQ